MLPHEVAPLPVETTLACKQKKKTSLAVAVGTKTKTWGEIDEGCNPKDYPMILRKKNAHPTGNKENLWRKRRRRKMWRKMIRGF